MLTSFWHLLQREYRELAQRKFDFFVITWIPLAIILLFPLIYYDSVPLDLPIIIVDNDNSSLSRSLARQVSASGRLQLIAKIDQLSAAQAAIRSGEASAVLYIPEGSARRATRDAPATIFLFYNNAYYTEGNFIAKEVGGVISGFNKRQTPTTTGNFVVKQLAPKSIAPLKVQLGSLFNSSNSYQWGLVSIIYPALLHLIVTAAFAVSFFRDYCTPCRESWLNIAGENIRLAFVSKLLFYTLWFSALSLISILYMVYLGWPVNGSLFSMLLGIFLMYCAYLFGASIIVLLLKEKLNTALSILSVFTSPALAYGNILFPLNTASFFVQGFSTILPFSHYIDIQARSWLGDAALPDNYKQLLFLLAACIVTGLISFRLVSHFLSRPLFLNSEAEA